MSIASAHPFSGSCPGGLQAEVVPPFLDGGATSQQPPVLVAADKAAQLCGVSLRTWRRFESEGLIPAPVMVGGRIKRYRRTEMLAWVEAGCPSREQWANIRQVEQRRRAK